MWERIASFTHAHSIKKGDIVSQMPDSTSGDFIITAIAAGYIALAHITAKQDAKSFPIDGLYRDEWWLKK